jgi:hypothetical protein
VPITFSLRIEGYFEKSRFHLYISESSLSTKLNVHKKFIILETDNVVVKSMHFC